MQHYVIINVNLLPPGPVFGSGRADARFDNVYQLEDSASSTYHGVSFAEAEAKKETPAWAAGYKEPKVQYGAISAVSPA